MRPCELQLTMLVEVVVELLAERLGIVQQLQCGEVDGHLRRTIFPCLGRRLSQLLDVALAFPSIFVDAGPVLCALEGSPRVGHRVLVFAVVLVVRVRLRAKEEVQSRRLHLGVGVERCQRGDGDSLRVGPHALAPQLAHHHDGPHGLAAHLLALTLALVADDLGTHAALDHAEQQALYDAVETVVLRPLVRRLKVGQDSLPDRLAEVTADMGQEGQEGLQKPDG